MLNEDKIKQFWKDGYLIVKNVYSQNEVETYRNFISKECKKNLGEESLNYKELEQKNLKDILSYPELQSVILNKKLISTIRDILGDEVVYWGYSSFRWNEKPYRSFHNDAKNDFDCPFTTKYPLVRVGVYLQNHSDFSNGVKIWKGSCHTLRYGRKLLKKIFIEKGSFKYLFPQQFYKSVNVKTEAGDVVIWNLRTCHSGSAVRLKILPNVSFHPLIENFIANYFPKMMIQEEKERTVIFSTFGAESFSLENFIKDNLKHIEMKNVFKNSSFLQNEEIKKKSKELNLKLKNVIS